MTHVVTTPTPISGPRQKADQIDQMTAMAKEILARTGIKQIQLARQIGIASSYMSNVVTGKRSEMEKWAQHKRDLVHRSLYDMLDGRYADTSNMRKVMSICRIIQEEAGRKTIVGPCGTGKTFTFEQYERQNPATTYYIRCRKTKSVRTALLIVAKAIGVLAADKKTVDSLTQAIIDKCEKIPGSLLILDDAYYFPNQFFAYLKDISDECTDVGIILGVEKQWMDKIKKRAGKTEAFEAILSRFANHPLEMQPMDQRDMESVLVHYGLNKDMYQVLKNRKNIRTAEVLDEEGNKKEVPVGDIRGMKEAIMLWRKAGILCRADHERSQGKIART